jgi:cell division transport system permease protein
MPRALAYFVTEALASLWRGRRVTVFSIAVIATALITLGAFLLVNANLERVLSRWSAAAEFSVYLRDEISQDDRAAVNRALAESPLVVSREYVSKAEALQRFTRDFPDLAGTAESVGQNPFPASIEVRLRPDAADDTVADDLAQHLRRLNGVADVRFDRRWLDRLSVAVTSVRWLGLLLAGMLVGAAALTVATVVRLALYARQEEIQIMQLVGAPLSYLRGPFVTEGIIQGGIGASVALIGLGIGYFVLRLWYEPMLGSIMAPARPGFLSVSACAWLLLGGMAVGCVGGAIAARAVR